MQTIHINQANNPHQSGKRSTPIRQTPYTNQANTPHQSGKQSTIWQTPHTNQANTPHQSGTLHTNQANNLQYGKHPTPIRLTLPTNQANTPHQSGKHPTLIRQTIHTNQANNLHQSIPKQVQLLHNLCSAGVKLKVAAEFFKSSKSAENKVEALLTKCINIYHLTGKYFLQNFFFATSMSTSSCHLLIVHKKKNEHDPDMET